MGRWLIFDGYEDEPAAFGVPNYLGFHIRYICGVLESRGIAYDYVTVDQWRIRNKNKRNNNSKSYSIDFSEFDGLVILAGAVVPGKYIRGTPLSSREINQVIDMRNEGKMLKSTMFMRSMQVMLLTFGSSLCVFYWVVGLYHYHSACPI